REPSRVWRSRPSSSAPTTASPAPCRSRPSMRRRSGGTSKLRGFVAAPSARERTRKMNRLLLGLAAAGLAACLLGPTASAKDDDDPAGHEWSQFRGNSSRSAGSAVEGLGGRPVEAWRQKLPGPVVGEPVTWGGTVFVAAQSGKSRRLLAFRSTTGEALGSTDLGNGTSRTALGSWQSVVIVGEDSRIRTFRHDGSKFVSAWSKSGSFGGPPCVYRGYVVVADGDELECLDVMRGGAVVAKGPVVSESAIAALPKGVDEKALKSKPRIGGA